MSAVPETTRPRRRLGIRLWALMLVVAAIASGLGWVRHRIRSQREAVEAVQRAGGYVGFNFSMEPAPPRQPSGPAWLTRLLSPQDAAYLFGDAVEIEFWSESTSESPPMDSVMPYLARFSQLERLELDTNSKSDTVSGSSLKHLRGLTQLKILLLESIRLTDDDLAYLSDLKQLRRLKLGEPKSGGSDVSDDGLRSLAGLSALEVLILPEQKRITGAGLLHLAGLTTLVSLNLDGSQITDANLVHLRGMTSLEHISLSRTTITDAGLSHLAGLAKLKTLALDNLHVTDAGLAFLSGLSNLERISLRGTQVTDKGMAEVSKLKRLGLIDVSRTKVGVEGALRFKDIRQLYCLYLDNHISIPEKTTLQRALPNANIYYPRD